jgi:hypothetical protein
VKSKEHLKIDLLQLYANTTWKEWCKFLAVCHKNQDLNNLEKVLYGVQLGMNDLVKKKMNTEKMIGWFIRIQRSIERTMRDIIREKEPSPLDDPSNESKFGHKLSDKRERDNEIEKYLKGVRF